MRTEIFNVGILIASLLLLPGCASKLSPLGAIQDGVSADQVQAIETSLNINNCILSSSYNKSCRNNFLTMKMYEVDVLFTTNVHDIARGDTAIALFSDVAQLGLSAAASTIPVGQTTKVLAAASTAVGLTNAALNKDVFLAQSLQLVEIQMRTDRASVKQTILARMSACSLSQYPIGLALSDLQAYADAGTLASALTGLSRTVSNTQPVPSEFTGTASAATVSATGSATGMQQAPASRCPITI